MHFQRTKTIQTTAAEDIIPDLPFTAVRQPDIKLDGYIIIEPVTIKAPVQPVRPKVYVDMHSKMYQSAGATTWYKKDFGPAFTLEDLFYKYNPFFINVNSWYINGMGKFIYLRANEHFTTQIVDGGTVVVNKMIPALIVVDNTPVGCDYEIVAGMPTSDIASITFLKGVQGVTMYGSKANGGVIFITTKIGSGYTRRGAGKMDEVKRNDDQLAAGQTLPDRNRILYPGKREGRK